jgi:hypothetical protein
MLPTISAALWDAPLGSGSPGRRRPARSRAAAHST